MALHRIVVLRDLPGHEVQHHQEGDRIIIRIGVDYSDTEASRIERQIRRLYDKTSPAMPIPVPVHRHPIGWAASAAAVTIATSLAVIVNPTQQPHPHPRSVAPVVVPAGDPGSAPDTFRRLVKPPARPAPVVADATVQPDVSPSLSMMDAQHPIRTLTGPHPVRSITGQHPIRHLLTPGVGQHPIRLLLQQRPQLPSPAPFPPLACP